LGKGISREAINYVAILIVLVLFLALVYIFFFDEINATIDKLMNMFRVKI